ncbi:MAG TPA: hypothetical protein VN496_02970, partial [Burkholderiales bacterium]|nr:hypothetical protein [Burkholderiales bacterium]
CWPVDPPRVLVLSGAFAALLFVSVVAQPPVITPMLKSKSPRATTDRIFILLAFKEALTG